ncbi:hypothetical protein BDV98DRAFT_608624 [Pterulicium gracile]|uniref:Uncharacterized protein n=1 Tax=Pterulicium gracile TaxID=1884261 RepID=A0A5C3Q4C1_9AGAR|nr:hypothetical protein BDV98DRAFT_608624 [Pterula gracilis]
MTGKQELPLPETTSQDNVQHGPAVSMLTSTPDVTHAADEESPANSASATALNNTASEISEQPTNTGSTNEQPEDEQLIADTDSQDNILQQARDFVAPKSPQAPDASRQV